MIVRGYNWTTVAGRQEFIITPIYKSIACAMSNLDNTEGLWLAGIQLFKLLIVQILTRLGQEV